MSENLTLKKYMEEDAFLFDDISKRICQAEDTNYEQLQLDCDNFEKNVLVFKILPSYYIMRTILCFKLNDYETAFKYINASLKYLVYTAKNTTKMTEQATTNYAEYKDTVFSQYKILTQEKPEYLNNKNIVVPDTCRFLITKNEELVSKEIDARLLLRIG